MKYIFKCSVCGEVMGSIETEQDPSALPFTVSCSSDHKQTDLIEEQDE